MSINIIISTISGLIKSLRAEAASLRKKADKHTDKSAALRRAAVTEQASAANKVAEATRAERFADKVETLITE